MDLIAGTKWDWIHDGVNVNRTIEFDADGKTLITFGASTRSMTSNKNGTVTVVCADIGAAGKHLLVMNDMLTEFSCPHSGQKGQIILQEGDAEMASLLLSKT